MAVAPTTPAAAPDGADPSMEEILASIRRILNEDDPAPQDEAARPEPEPPGDDDVLLLDASMMVVPPEPAAPVEETPVEAAAPVAPQPDPLPVRAQEISMPPPPADDSMDELVAPAAAAAAASSLGSLMRTLSASKAPQIWGGGPTLEDMVRSELRVLLKDWLDSNLPPMVERMVRSEIERVVGRGVP